MTQAGTAAGLLRAGALAAGLAPELAGFPREGGLAQRLAAHPFLMAPMAGVSDAAYRMMARAGGASLAYTEMVSVAGLHYGGAKTWELVEPHDPESDVAVQLFGSQPAQFAEAAELVSARLGERLGCSAPDPEPAGELRAALLLQPDESSEQP